MVSKDNFYYTLKVDLLIENECIKIEVFFLICSNYHILSIC